MIRMKILHVFFKDFLRLLHAVLNKHSFHDVYVRITKLYLAYKCVFWLFLIVITYFTNFGIKYKKNKT